jgi:hypothetical protein
MAKLSMQYATTTRCKVYIFLGSVLVLVCFVAGRDCDLEDCTRFRVATAGFVKEQNCLNALHLLFFTMEARRVRGRPSVAYEILNDHEQTVGESIKQFLPTDISSHV